MKPLRLAALLLLPALLAHGQESQASQEGWRTTLAWLQSLGASEAAGRPYVHVYYVGGILPKDRRELAYRGFLLDDRADSFRVWCLDLLPRRLTHGPIPQGRGGRWQVERVDLDAGVREVVEALKRRGEGDAGCASSLLQDQAAVLASVCLKAGKDELAKALCTARVGSLTTASFMTRIGQVLRGHCVRSFGEADFSRGDLLAFHRKFLRLFPNEDEEGEIAARAKVLEAMIAEDEARRRQPRLESRSSDREIDDLIFALRDITEPLFPVTGMNETWPGKPYDWERGGAVSRLIAIGHAAVPKLIESLLDDRPTRCAEFSYGSLGSHELHVNPVSSYALAIIEEIARCRFCPNEPDGGVIGVQAAVRKWWTQLQRDGEPAALAAIVEAGRWNVVHAARRLAVVDPDRAVMVVAAALDRAEGPQRRGDLVIAYGETPREAAVPQLLRWMQSSPDFRSRLEAAKALHRRGRPEALAAMLREWNRDALSDEGGAGFYDHTNDSWNPLHPFLDIGYGVWSGQVAGELAAFLAGTGDPAAGAVLLEKLETGSWLHRWAAMSAGLATGVESRPSMRPLSRKCEELLVAELGNQGPSRTWATKESVMITDGESFHLRWCDDAAAWLSRFRPARYRFDWATPVADRDRQIAAIREAWRISAKTESPDSDPAPESRPETRSESRPGR